MGKLWDRTQDADGKSKLNEVDLATLRINAPTLVYLSGFLTNNNRPDYVAGGIKRMEELLKDRTGSEPAPKIYAWSHTSLKNLFNLALYNMRPKTRSSDAGYDLGAGVLMPLVAASFKRNADGSLEGTPVPLEDAKKNLSNVTFFGYSAGSIVAQETFNATMQMMQKIGFAEKDARRALNEVVLVSAGSISRPSKETNRFKTIYLVASNDRIMRMKNWIWGTMGTALRTAFGKYGWRKNSKDLTVRPLSDTSVFISTSVKPELHEIKYDADGKPADKKPIQPLYPAWTLRRSYHELPHYITIDDNNNAFARIALYALTNAITRRGDVAAIDLISPPQQDSHSAEAQAAYRSRIEQALRPAPAAFVQNR
ncbi:MAG: hypothetical protein PW788_14070 [Micavibrio sp.]|nr:hypothetical protein [Micavibrio sp.]